MKNLMFLVIVCLSLAFTSCEKQQNTRPNPPTDTIPATNWYDEYTDSGTVPINTNTNPLIGTKWIVDGFSQIILNNTPHNSGDTLEFISNNVYEIHTVQYGVFHNRQYSLADILGGPYSTLTLNNFTSIGISSYSIKVGDTFISDGVVIAGIATDIYASNTKLYVWLHKI
jgi:hypothetical protein